MVREMINHYAKNAIGSIRQTLDKLMILDVKLEISKSYNEATTDHKYIIFFLHIFRGAHGMARI